MCVTRYNPDECKQSWGCDASRVTLFPRPNPPPAATTAEQVEFPSEDQEKEESDEKGRGARAGKGWQGLARGAALKLPLSIFFLRCHGVHPGELILGFDSLPDDLTIPRCRLLYQKLLMADRVSCSGFCYQRSCWWLSSFVGFSSWR